MGQNLIIARNDDKPFWIKYILRRIKNNKNFLLLCCGETGSGKSYGALRLGEVLAKEQGKKPSAVHLVFAAKDFMNKINSGEMKRGDILIFDEAGVGLPSREWHNISNKMLNYVLQTFRFMGLIVIFTTPDISYIDSQARKLFHGYWQTTGIDHKKKLCYFKCFIVQNNSFVNKTYYKYLKVVYKGNLITIDKLPLRLPSKKIIDEYEAKKTIFAEWLNKGAEIGIRTLSKEIVYEKTLTDFQKKVYDLNQIGKLGIEIADELGVKPQAISNTLQLIKSKGYIVNKPSKKGKTGGYRSE